MSEKPADREREGPSRREFMRRAAYTAPVLLTLPAVPAMAQSGSGGLCATGEVPFFNESGDFLGCDS